MESTTCCIVGGGPAGLMLGLLLARAGVEVRVLEKHPDFLRDFRGDTIHASTLELVEELGFLDELEHRRHDVIEQLRAKVNGLWLTVADFSRLRTRHPCLYLMPQWDFLELLAKKGAEEPTFHLERSAEVIDLLEEDGRVGGVVYRSQGETKHLRADLTVSCDGRASILRARRGLTPIELGAPMDVLWFRLPHHEGDAHDTFGIIDRGRMLILLDRGDYWQAGYLVPKGDDARLRSRGIDRFRSDLAEVMPLLGDGRLAALSGWDDIFTLDVRVNHLPRWFYPGLLFIGDSAHAMSPIGGVGVNLALQDAVAAARILAKPLLRRNVTLFDLARVQLRRGLPALLTQVLQLFVQHRVIHRVLSGKISAPPVRLARALGPRMQTLTARLIALGLLPEHWAPANALRSQGASG